MKFLNDSSNASVTRKVWKAMDYGLSLGTVAWGAWYQNWYILAAGLLGVAFAYWAPAEKMKKRIRKNVVLEPKARR